MVALSFVEKKGKKRMRFVPNHINHTILDCSPVWVCFSLQDETDSELGEKTHETENVWTEDALDNTYKH